MPRGEPYSDRCRAAVILLQRTHPTMTLEQVAHREGIAPNTLRNLAASHNIDIRLYHKRAASVRKRIVLIQDLRALDALIAMPITKKEQ